MRFEHSSCIVSFSREMLCFTWCQYKVYTTQQCTNNHNHRKCALIYHREVVLDDPNYPNSQGIKCAEVRCIVHNVLYTIQCTFRGCDTVGSAWIRLGSRAI